MTTMSAPTPSESIADALQQVVSPYQQDGNPALGPSKISTYLRCPRAYRYQYVDRIARKSSPAAALGTTVHAVVRHIHAARWTADRAEDAAKMMLQAWGEVRGETSDPDNPDASAGAQAAAMEWLPWYLGWIKGQVDVAFEERWELPYRYGIVMRGTIDRVYRQDGRRVLSDVKSGKRTPSAGDLANDLQLSIYSWACGELGIPPDTCELVMIRQRNTVETVRSAEYVAAVMEETVVDVARGIEAGLFPCNTCSQFGCGFCDYKSLCAVGQGDNGGEAA